MNKYLQKLAEITAEEKAIAEKSSDEEKKAIKDYTSRLDRVKNGKLRDAIKHARSEEHDHFKGFEDVLKG